MVVREWLRTIPDLVGMGGVADWQLPLDNETWGPTGFVLIRPPGGGRHSSYIPVSRPVITMEFYAVEPNTGQPVWHTAGSLLSTVVAAMRDESTMRRHLAMNINGVDYGKCMVQNAYPINHERMVYGDEGQYAHLILDTQFHWLQLEEGQP
jgi:hypothetical protein